MLVVEAIFLWIFVKKGGKKTYEEGIGIHGMTSEARKKAGKKTYEEGIGIHGMTSEALFEARKKGGKKVYEEGIGIHGMTSEALFEARKEGGKKGARKQHTQKWQCTETRYISTPCGLSSYQKARGIDTSNRIRVQ